MLYVFLSFLEMLGQLLKSTIIKLSCIYFLELKTLCAGIIVEGATLCLPCSKGTAYWLTGWKEWAQGRMGGVGTRRQGVQNSRMLGCTAPRLDCLGWEQSARSWLLQASLWLSSILNSNIASASPLSFLLPGSKLYKLELSNIASVSNFKFSVFFCSFFLPCFILGIFH